MEFLNPQYLSEAFEILDTRKKDVQIVAGMTHLLRCYPRFPEGVPSAPRSVLHIGDLQVLSDCREETAKYAIGATTRISSLEADPYLARYAPAVLDAAHSTSTPQIRNRRTLGGEIAWGSFHSPLITTLTVLGARVRVRLPGETGIAGREESFDLLDFYKESGDAVAGENSKEDAPNRHSKLNQGDLMIKVGIPNETIHAPGHFCFFRSLMPKISTENSGVVIAVSGTARSGMIESANVVASGLWMSTLHTRLPLEGVRMSDAYIFEKLYSFCDRFSFDKYRRAGPSGSQLGLVVFGLLKEGFTGLLGR